MLLSIALTILHRSLLRAGPAQRNLERMEMVYPRRFSLTEPIQSACVVQCGLEAQLLRIVFVPLMIGFVRIVVVVVPG